MVPFTPSKMYYHVVFEAYNQARPERGGGVCWAVASTKSKLKKQETMLYTQLYQTLYVTLQP